MKMRFLKEKCLEELKMIDVVVEDDTAKFYDKLDRKVFEFDGDLFISNENENGDTVCRCWCVPLTAKDHFEELGYDVHESDRDCICFRKETISENGRKEYKYVIFDKSKRTFETYDESLEDCIAVDRELMDAIVQQFREFGW